LGKVGTYNLKLTGIVPGYSVTNFVLFQVDIVDACLLPSLTIQSSGISGGI